MKYPRASVKKALTRRTKNRVAGRLDGVIFLNYLLFMKRLAERAEANMEDAGDQVVHAAHVRDALPLVLKELRG